MNDADIVNALRTGKLRPSMVGLRQIEVRYYGMPFDVRTARELSGPDAHICELVSVLYDDSGRVGTFMHCDASATDRAGDTIEGIGGEYADVRDGYGDCATTSYLSDDKKLLALVRAIVEGEGNG